MVKSEGLAGNKLIGPGSIVTRQENSRPGFEGRRSTRSFSKYSVLTAALATALTLTPSVSSALNHSFSSPISSSLTLTLPRLGASFTQSSPTLSTPHSTRSHEFNRIEATCEGEDTRAQGDINMPMLPRDPLHPEHPSSGHSDGVRIIGESAIFATFTGRLIWSHGFTDAWTSFEHCAENSDSCGLRLLNVNLTAGYARGTALNVMERPDGQTARFYGNTDTGLAGFSTLFGFRSARTNFLVNFGLFGTYVRSTADTVARFSDGERAPAHFETDRFSLGPLTLDVRVVTGRGYNFRFGGALYNPTSNLSNFMSYLGAERVWSSHASTVLTAGVTHLDHQWVPYLESFPIYASTDTSVGRFMGGLGVKLDFIANSRTLILDTFGEGCFISRGPIGICGIVGREGPANHFFDDFDTLDSNGPHDPPMNLYGIATIRINTWSGPSTSH